MAESILVLFVDQSADAEPAADEIEAQDPRIDVEIVAADEALARLESTTVDCVVAEYDLPGTDGLSLLERVRDHRPDVPFVLFTGSGSEAVASRAFAAGATDYVRKGAENPNEALARRVEAALVDVPNRRLGGRHQYEAILESMGDGAYLLDSEGRLVHANESAERLVGLDREAHAGSPVDTLFDEDGVAAFESAIADLLGDEDCSVATVETTLHRVDGESVPVEVTLTVLTEDDQFLGTVGVVRDVTEHRERERKLDHYETLLELMPDSVIVTDLEGTILDIHGFEGWSGYDYDELVGERFSKVTPEADVEHVEELVADLVFSEDRSTATYETEIVTREGDVVHFENHITLLPPDEDEDVPGTMSVLRNITERVEREAQLERQNERLEEFAGIVSHDLRNPLNVAKGHLQLSREQSDDDHLETVAGSLDRMEQLIEDLLALARDSDDPADREDVSYADVVEEAWETVSTGDATLDVAADGTVRADPSRLRQLFENLLRNAVEHGGEDVTVTVGDTDAGFYVADDGPGIDPEHRDRIFESGYTTVDGGTGFGLAIVHEVACEHGWSVDYRTSAEGGARFDFRVDGE